MKMEFGENQGKTGAERGQRGTPGGGRAVAELGSPCPPAAPVAPPAALLLKPMLCFIFLPFNQINHKTQLQGKRGGRGWFATCKQLAAGPGWQQRGARREQTLPWDQDVARRAARWLAGTRQGLG